MFSSSTFRRASIVTFCRTAMDTLFRSTSDPQKLYQPSACGPPTHRARIGAMTGLFVISSLFVVLAAPSAVADPSGPGRIGPDEADLQFYFDCSEVASLRLLSFDEADVCSRVFMRIKLSFVPGVGLNDYDSLPPREKSAVNIVGYKLYLDWLSKNPVEVEFLKNAPLSPAFAAH